MAARPKRLMLARHWLPARQNNPIIMRPTVWAQGSQRPSKTELKWLPKHSASRGSPRGAQQRDEMSICAQTNFVRRRTAVSSWRADSRANPTTDCCWGQHSLSLGEGQPDDEEICGCIQASATVCTWSERARHVPWGNLGCSQSRTQLKTDREHLERAAGEQIRRLKLLTWSPGVATGSEL